MSQPLQRRARVADVQPGAVAAQTHAPPELILVDDESTDYSMAVAEASGAKFDRTIAQYEADFGYTHLQCGDSTLGVRTLLRAWRHRPTAWRPLALAVAAMLGWRPGGGVPTSGTLASRP